MKTTTRRVLVLVTAGAFGLGVVAVAVPAFAGVGPFGGWNAASAGSGRDGGNASGAGMGMGGPGMNSDGSGDGSCLGAAGLPDTGTLTEQQKSTLAAMAQEEKLAHDLYVAFAARYEAAVFDRIAGSETQHLAMVRMLLDRYGLVDPTAGQAEGHFSDPTVQATYDRLLGQGNADVAAAARVGQTVEQTDIADLRAAQNGLTAPDVTVVYQRLLQASQQHLTAFQRWS
jgi:hypothetical protein